MDLEVEYTNNTSNKLEQDERQQLIVERIEESPIDSISFETKRISSLPIVSIENLGLFIEGMVPLHRDESISWFAGLHLEVIQRQLTTIL